MKKTIMACASALLVLGATGCNGNGGSTSADNTFGDSVSTYFGKVNGGMLASRIKESPEAASWSKESVLRGIETALKADTSDMGYMVGLSIGVQMAQQLKGISEDVDGFSYAKTIAAFEKAFKADSVPGLNADNLEFQRLMGEVRARAEEKRKAALENSPEAIQGTKDGEAYIAKLKAEDPEIKTTASGLSYKVVKEGSGEKPAATDVAKVKYTGKLIDGTVFDSSEGNVVDFPVSRVVPGFSEGLQLMTPGSTYIFYIPGNLAYGAQGAPQAGITPNATLTFEVELVGVDAR
ncbi:MAG: FKBP-type peptidyl-prolyl cis-trans isomerase [Pseudoflavonifractor sp.]|nr:FKBP-type peptidyl-prolyl cis-trans isomerase [Pseudoflavonifractor sp.]